ncbi:hypothetical protein FOPE_12712 [Fonsecaea pedrosoi]|nr:hypothetical protein FOPE_12712 [Fonsecaea pedrosoi]
MATTMGKEREGTVSVSAPTIELLSTPVSIDLLNADLDLVCGTKTQTKNLPDPQFPLPTTPKELPAPLSPVYGANRLCTRTR